MNVQDLDAADYFRNFPHLGLAAAPITDSEHLRLSQVSEQRSELPSTALSNARYMLPSAACYAVYAQLKGQIIETPLRVTTSATCFRNETAYEGLERLWAFTMQEIVCFGTVDHARQHVETGLEAIRAMASAIGITLDVEIATDPFFDRRSPVALLQEKAPTKRELLFGTLAVASVNFHRNFFGDRFNIRDSQAKPVFTSCVAFGLERWMHMLLQHFDGDAVTAVETVNQIDPAVS
jgi:seryl-tRNA synthetase